ncbi:MAG: 50S ribosomal protein L23 [Candidatus Omnitrophota bacterium]
MEAQDVILFMLQTERTTRIRKWNKYAFAVAPQANKIQIRQAVEKIFNVKVKDVNTMIIPGKWRRIGRSQGRKPDWKKAVVTLKEGYKIE